jgi:cation:H+ antiporter
MWTDIISLSLSLAIILLSCELFTNGIEWLGQKLKLGDGVVGSIFSAIGTCLPETMVPIIAILFAPKSGKVSDSVDIGIGAIMGAPFMLSTLAFFISGISVFIFWRRRKTGTKMMVNSKILSRDIGFFIIVYSVGLGAAFVQTAMIKYIIAGALITFYIFYIFLTVRQDQESHGELEMLYLVKFVKAKPNMVSILFQIVLALLGIIIGAELFVEDIKHISEIFGISTLVLSLIITPIATELPEKFNSIIWISKKKDTLALGNVTGAMVFQSCIPVTIGILTTSWILDTKVIVSAVLSILSASITYLWIKTKGSLKPYPLMAGGVLYVIFIAYILSTGIR